ncbi:hypothetical protein [Dongia sp. agr-C8]
MRFRGAALISLVLILAGCAAQSRPSPEIPITGRVIGSGEVFRGYFKGSISSSGTVMLSRSGGATCTGDYSNASPGLGGTVALTCDDGRKADILLNQNRYGKLFGVGAVGDDSFVIEE